jgi:hypothetical protein
VIRAFAEGITLDAASGSAELTMKELPEPDLIGAGSCLNKRTARTSRPGRFCVGSGGLLQGYSRRDGGEAGEAMVPAEEWQKTTASRLGSRGNAVTSVTSVTVAAANVLGPRHGSFHPGGPPSDQGGYHPRFALHPGSPAGEASVRVDGCSYWLCPPVRGPRPGAGLWALSGVRSSGDSVELHTRGRAPEPRTDPARGWRGGRRTRVTLS